MAKRKDTPDVTRSLTTDAAIALGPTLAVVANHVLNKPKKNPPPPQRQPKKD